MKKYKIGFTQGTFDTLHYGHINLLEKAKEHCEYLVVGVNSDELVKEYKKTSTIIKTSDRVKIVESIKYVDKVIITETLDKNVHLNHLKYNVIFIGDDWKGSERWNKTEDDLNKLGVSVVYIPYTKSISTTIIKSKIKE